MIDLSSFIFLATAVLNLSFERTASQEAQPVSGALTDRREQASDEPERTERDPRDRPTAEEILEALQRQRPANEVIPPSSRPISRQADRLALLPEGAAVVDRSGRLAWKEPWWTFVSDSAGDPVIKLLPNANLEVMVRTAGGSDSTVRFVVSGETTVFQDENYLLVRLVRRSAGAGTLPAQAAASKEKETPIDVDRTPDRSPVDQDSTRTGGEPSETSAEDLVSLLQRQRPQEMMPISPPPTASRPIVSRPGRLVRQGDWWTFVFESDHPDYPEPPMRLLPNKSVELMMETSERETHGLVFLVSGETTVFQDEDYLLPRSAMLQVDSGNLRP